MTDKTLDGGKGGGNDTQSPIRKKNNTANINKTNKQTTEHSHIQK